MIPTVPSGVHIGCTPPAMSMIDRRRWPRWTRAAGSIQWPSASGPRCAIAAFIARISRWPPSPTNPAIPHMALGARTRRPEVARFLHQVDALALRLVPGSRHDLGEKPHEDAHYAGDSHHDDHQRERRLHKRGVCEELQADRPEPGEEAHAQ